MKPLSKFGDQVPQIKQLAQQFGLESGVIVGGVLTLVTLITFAIFGSSILTLVITVLYPSFKSIQALETKSNDDDKEWLTYWIIFGLFSLIDDCCGCLLSFIPYFYWIKLAFFIYLLAPQTRGAQFLYNTVVKQQLHKYKSQIESLISDVKGSVKEVASEAKNTAVKELNNPQNLLKAAQVASSAQSELTKLEGSDRPHEE